MAGQLGGHRLARTRRAASSGSRRRVWLVPRNTSISPDSASRTCTTIWFASASFVSVFVPRTAGAAGRAEAATAGSAVPARAVAAIPATPAPAAPRRTERRDRRCCGSRSAPVPTAGEPVSSLPLMDIPSGAGPKPFAPALTSRTGVSCQAGLLALNWTYLDGAAEVAADPADHCTEPGRDGQSQPSMSDPGQDGKAADGHVLTRAFPPRSYFGPGDQADGCLTCRD
jgi:hypothetical protein